MEKRLIRQLTDKKPDLIRTLKEMKSVLYDQKWLKTAKNFPVYYVWRGVKWEGDIRYDITVIPPRMLGKEFPKTKGNRNSDKFPELYTVLEGEAIFLFQKMKEKTIKEIIAIRAKKGDHAIASSEYVVITINSSKKKLEMGNWVSKRNENIYGEIEPFSGAGYYYTKSGWIKNKNYAKIPSLRLKKPLKGKPRNLDFLYGKD